MSKQVSVHTQDFEHSHGRKPQGRGLWTFVLENHPGSRRDETLQINGNYDAAVGKAKKTAAANGFNQISVQP